MSSRRVDPEVRVVKGIGEIAREAAEEFSRRAEESVVGRGSFSVALSGGSTPRSLYVLLADPGEPYRARIPWDRIHFFWGDERQVPPDHPDSNYRMARVSLLSKVPLPPEHIHRIRTEWPDADEAAAEYEREIRSFFRLKRGERPRFDIILLGMGTDGHTASLFPGTDVLHEKERLVSAVRVEKLRSWRISLTLPVLNHAASVIFLVSGAGKAGTLESVLYGPYRPDILPAQLIRPVSGHLLWLVDRPARGFGPDL